MPTSNLARVVEAMHGCRAVFRETARVVERWEGEIAWEGDVSVFDVGHPKASKAYAWSEPTHDGKARTLAVLGIPPVNSAADAVRAALVRRTRDEDQ